MIGRYFWFPRVGLLIPLAAALVVLADLDAQGAEVSCNTGGDAAGWAVATGFDVNGDGVADVAVGEPCARLEGLRSVGRVTVFSGSDGAVLRRFRGSQADQKLGAAIAFSEDVDGRLEIVTGPMVGQPRIKAFRGTGSPFVPPGATSPVDFFAPSPAFNGGVRVAVADVDLDGQGEILVVQGAGATLRILAYEANGSAVAGWSAPQPFGPTSSVTFAIATTDRFLRQP